MKPVSNIINKIALMPATTGELRLLTYLNDWCFFEFQLNPDFEVEIVVSGKKAIKTGVCAGFLVESIVNYGEVKNQANACI